MPYACTASLIALVNSLVAVYKTAVPKTTIPVAIRLSTITAAPTTAPPTTTGAIANLFESFIKLRPGKGAMFGAIGNQLSY